MENKNIRKQKKARNSALRRAKTLEKRAAKKVTLASERLERAKKEAARLEHKAARLYKKGYKPISGVGLSESDIRRG